MESRALPFTDPGNHVYRSCCCNRSNRRTRHSTYRLGTSYCRYTQNYYLVCHSDHYWRTDAGYWSFSTNGQSDKNNRDHTYAIYYRSDNNCLAKIKRDSSLGFGRLEGYRIYSCPGWLDANGVRCKCLAILLDAGPQKRDGSFCNPERGSPGF